MGQSKAKQNTGEARKSLFEYVVQDLRGPSSVFCSAFGKKKQKESSNIASLYSTSTPKSRTKHSTSGYFLSPSASTASRALPYLVGGFSLAFVASCVTASIMTPVQNSDAISTVSLDQNAVAYYVNIASATNGTAGVVSTEIQATPAGTYGVAKDSLKITSNTPNGYYVYVSMANNTNGQKLVNTKDSQYSLSPIKSGSLDTPSTLSDANTWGVAVTKTYNDKFDTAYTNITANSKFAPVPAYGAEERLITRTGSTVKAGAETDQSKATVDSIDVYYGYYVNAALPSGTYQNTVLYTAYAEATDTEGGIAAYTGDLVYKTGGPVTFTTSLYTDREVKKEDFKVTIGGLDCPITSVSKVEAGKNDSVRIVCNAPAQSKPGDYEAKIVSSRFAHSSSTTVSYELGEEGGIIATVKDKFYQIKTMQEMANTPGVTSTEICQAWTGGLDKSNPTLWDSEKNAPKPYTTGDAPVYMYGADLKTPESAISGDWAANWATVTATRDATAGSAISNINTIVPEAYLKDERDGNYYRIRKLADGNCWMTENLRLVFYGTEGGQTVVGIPTNNGTKIEPSKDANGKNIVINTENTQITGDGLAALASTVVQTETSTNHTIWTGTTMSNTAEASAISMKESRSYYNNDKSTKSGDPQVAGTYYNWKAATGGMGDTTATSRPNDSVCPTGWQLPVGTGNKSFDNLLSTVYASGTVSSGDPSSSNLLHKSGGAHIYAIIQTMHMSPLSIVSSGVYRYYNGTSDGLNSLIYTWTSSVRNNDAATYLYASDTSYASTNGTYLKGNGHTVRCVAR